MIFTGPNYDDFEAVVDELDSSLVLDAVFYYSDGTNVVKSWAILNSANSPIFVSSGDYVEAVANSTFTTDFPSAVQLNQSSFRFM